MRHQPPVYSPLSAAALLRLLPSSGGDDAIGSLRALLLRDYAADGLVLCGSGTQALRLAIHAAASRFGPDVPVAIPAFTCFDVAAAAVAAGHPLLLFDIDPDTLAPDPASLTRVLEAGARVLVVSPLYGVPVPWEPVARLAAEHGAILIEDAAQGHGASWNGRPLGSLGAISVLSFGRGKGWTGGRGGAVLFRHDRGGREALACAQSLRTAAGGTRLLASTAAQWLLGRPALYRIPAALPWLGLGETRYHDAAPPAELPEAAARLLLATHAAAQQEAAARRQTAQRFAAWLDGRSITTAPIAEGGVAGYLRFPLRLAARPAGGPDREAARRLGIAPSYPAPLGTLPPVRRLLSAASDRAWPGAETLARDLITLPTHSLLSPRDHKRVLHWIALAAAP